MTDRDACRIAIFARPVVAGRTKTRLAAALGDAGAATLYGAFLEDVVRTCRRAAAATGAALELWVAGDPDHPSLRTFELPRVQQPDTDLGSRMATALTHCRGPAVVVGSDAPTLPAALIVEALDVLHRDRADVVLSPATDGGFTLIGGVDHPLPLSTAIRWSHRETLLDTLAALHAVHLRVAQLTPWYDVDTSADLRVLRTHLALQPHAAPATAAALAALGRGF